MSPTIFLVIIGFLIGFFIGGRPSEKDIGRRILFGIILAVIFPIAFWFAIAIFFMIVAVFIISFIFSLVRGGFFARIRSTSNFANFSQRPSGYIFLRYFFNM